MASYYQILGIAPDADLTEVEHAFVRLRQSLASQDFEDDEKGKAQARKCLDAFEKAYETLKDPDKRKNYDQRLSAESEGGHEGSKKPRLGQLCVASGIITVEQLTEAVEEQLDSGLPLGEVLENLHFLSRAELEGLLLGQDRSRYSSAGQSIALRKEPSLYFAASLLWLFLSGRTWSGM